MKFELAHLHQNCCGVSIFSKQELRTLERQQFTGATLKYALQEEEWAFVEQWLAYCAKTDTAVDSVVVPGV